MSTVIWRPNSDDNLINCSTFGSGTGVCGRINEVTADDSNGFAHPTSGTTENYAEARLGVPNTSLSGTINSVTIYCRAANYIIAEVGVSYIGLGVRIGGTQNLTQEGLSYSATSYQLYSRTMTQNPISAAAWTWQNINDMQLVLRSGFWTDKGNAAVAMISQAFIVCDYTPPSAGAKLPPHLFFNRGVL